MSRSKDKKKTARQSPVYSAPALTPTTKDTAGKTRFHLLAWDAIQELVTVREFGIRKYGEKNGWLEVGTPDAPFEELYTDAIIRHAVALARGEELDPESGLHHAAHIGCDSMFLIAKYVRHGASSHLATLRDLYAGAS